MYSSRGTVRRTRTIVKDKDGNILAQEVEEEFIPDMDDEDEISAEFSGGFIILGMK